MFDLDKLKFPYTLTIIVYGASLAVGHYGFAWIAGENIYATGGAFAVMLAFFFWCLPVAFVADLIALYQGRGTAHQAGESRQDGSGPYIRRPPQPLP